MRKIFFSSIAVLVAVLGLAVTTAALGANPKPGSTPEVVVTKKCPAPKSQRTYSGRVIVYVSGNGCVSIDRGAVAIASGNATVAAHGDSSVVASGNVTLVVYNESVACSVKGHGVTVVSAIKDRGGWLSARCLAARPQKK